MSIETTIQDAVIAALSGDLASLKIDARDVAVWTHFPEQAFTAKELPVIVVELPTMIGKENWDTSSTREEHAVPIAFVDSYKPTSDGKRAANERLSELRKKFEARLRVKGFLGLAGISVMPGFWDLSKTPGPPQENGNNLMRSQWTLNVPVIVPI